MCLLATCMHSERSKFLTCLKILLFWLLIPLLTYKYSLWVVSFQYLNTWNMSLARGFPYIGIFSQVTAGQNSIVLPPFDMDYLCPLGTVASGQAMNGCSKPFCFPSPTIPVPPLPVQILRNRSQDRIRLHENTYETRRTRNKSLHILMYLIPVTEKKGRI